MLTYRNICYFLALELNVGIYGYLSNFSIIKSMQPSNDVLQN